MPLIFTNKTSFGTNKCPGMTTIACRERLPDSGLESNNRRPINRM
jgi:hypothetical protein